MFAPTATRVNENTSRVINQQIRRTTKENIEYFVHNKYAIPGRLAQLDDEWDVERALATGSATLTLAGLALSYFVHPYMLVLSIAVQAFYLQHALQGWCPPLPLFRKLGFRTEKEIQFERNELKALYSAARL